MAFTMHVRRVDHMLTELDLAGELDDVRQSLRSQLLKLITMDRVEVLQVNLTQVTALNEAGVVALMFGYAKAVDYGTTYRVRHAHGTVECALRLAGVLDVLADSEDLGALLVAAILCTTAP